MFVLAFNADRNPSRSVPGVHVRCVGNLDDMVKRR
jgi:hypothetical protein